MERYSLTFEEHIENMFYLTLEFIGSIILFMFIILRSSEPWDLMAYQHFGTCCSLFCFGTIFPELFRGHPGWSLFGRFMLSGIPFFACAFPFLIIGRYIWFAFYWRRKRI